MHFGKMINKDTYISVEVGIGNFFMKICCMRDAACETELVVTSVDTQGNLYRSFGHVK